MRLSSFTSLMPGAFTIIREIEDAPSRIGESKTRTAAAPRWSPRHWCPLPPSPGDGISQSELEETAGLHLIFFSFFSYWGSAVGAKPRWHLRKQLVNFLNCSSVSESSLLLCSSRRMTNALRIIVQMVSRWEEEELSRVLGGGQRCNKIKHLQWSRVPTANRNNCLMSCFLKSAWKIKRFSEIQQPKLKSFRFYSL